MNTENQNNDKEKITLLMLSNSNLKAWINVLCVGVVVLCGFVVLGAHYSNQDAEMIDYLHEQNKNLKEDARYYKKYTTLIDSLEYHKIDTIYIKDFTPDTLFIK